MTLLRRGPARDLSPLPAEVLSPAELARMARYKAVYTVGALFGIDSDLDASQLLDRLEFARWRQARLEDGS